MKDISFLFIRLSMINSYNIANDSNLKSFTVKKGVR